MRSTIMKMFKPNMQQDDTVTRLFKSLSPDLQNLFANDPGNVSMKQLYTLAGIHNEEKADQTKVIHGIKNNHNFDIAVTEISYVYVIEQMMPNNSHSATSHSFPSP